ncbi:MULTISPECIES: nucleotide exchange factor GrpE [unclassified Frondihabitans]|jgi:molecular chaperone GrpE|uniref:nucleotide exchange factor GrpE n=1 Tax=unclassified Frondihabitans TaxID=2626248 RepID=UPI000ADC7581|nr:MULTISPECIES: nucleotide exchange factor GrpE [unclassified Frondihabitans]
MVDEKNGAPDEEPTVPAADQPQPGEATPSEDGGTADVDGAEELIEAEGPDVELSTEDEAILDQASVDLVADMRQDMLRAQAELVNFRKRVERDREANRDAVIAEVVRAVLPALDDLSRAEQHGDLADGPMVVIAQKLRGGFDRFGLTQIGAKGDVFDPKIHEAIVQLPTADVTVNTVADVIEPGYTLGDRVLRAAKVAVSVPA